VTNWDSLYIYYISGTGNARISSKWIAEEAEKRGFKTVVQQIDRLENIVMPAPGEKPLIGFAYPTHGFNAAPIMLRFIAGFPSKLCKEIFLLNTRAGMKLYKFFMPGLSGLALVLPAFILWLKGYKCIGFRPIDLPSNWIPLHPGLREKILNRKRIYRGLYSLPVDLLISPIAAAYYIGGRFFLSKTFIANSKCNNCGICIKECPTSSIRLVRNRPYWKLTCESCMRCLNNCPERAIEAAHGLATGIMILITVVNTRLIIFIIDSLNIQPDVWWWKVLSQLIGIGVMILMAALIYSIVHFAMGFKPISFIVRFTSFTTFPFWRRYKYLKEKKYFENKTETTSNHKT
jgi:hypothetical protein